MKSAKYKAHIACLLLALLLLLGSSEPPALRETRRRTHSDPEFHHSQRGQRKTLRNAAVIMHPVITTASKEEADSNSDRRQCKTSFDGIPMANFACKCSLPIPDLRGRLRSEPGQDGVHGSAQTPTGPILNLRRPFREKKDEKKDDKKDDKAPPPPPANTKPQ